MLRATSETDLFQDICRVCVKFGHFGLAWIAVQKEGRICTVAAAGPMKDYLDGLEVNTDPDDLLGQGPSGRAFRGERHVVCQDWDREPRMAPWLQRAAGFGIRSSGSFPVISQAGVQAVLTLYTDQRDAFRPEKVEVLDELTEDMAFALDKFREERLRREAETALQLKHQLYADLVQHQPSGVYRVVTTPQAQSLPADGHRALAGLIRVDFVSERFCELLGITREAFTADPNLHVSRLHPDDRQAFLDRRAQALAAGRGFRWEGRLGTDPDPRWVRFESFPRVLGEGGTVWTGLLTDITESKQAEARAEEQRDHYQDLVSALPSGIYRLRVRPAVAVPSTDWEHEDLPRYEIEFVSDRFCDILGVSREAFQADTSLVMARIHPDDRASFNARNAEALVGLLPFFWEGRLVDEGQPRWIRFESVPRPLPDGGCLWTGVLTDITRRRRTSVEFRRLHSLLQQTERIAKVGGWEIDLEQNTLYWSDEVFRIHELDPGSHTPEVESSIQFYAPEWRPVIAQAVQRAIDTGENFDLDLELLTATGRRLWVHATSQVVLRDGRAVKVQGTFQDISEKRLAEAALKASETRARTMLQTTLEGVWLVRRDGTFEEMNESACRMMGYSREELLTLGIWDLEAQEQPEEIRDRMRRIEETGQDIFETTLRRKDGSLFPAEVSVMVIAQTGEQVAFVRDVTERKQKEEALQASEEKNRALIRAIPDLIFTTSRDGVYLDVHVSDPNLLFVPPESFLHRKLDEILPGPLAAQYREAYARAFETGQVQELEYTLTIGGSDLAFEARVVPAEQERAITIVRDITERKATEAALRESEARYRTLFDNNHAIKLLVDPADSRIVDANPAAARFYGWTQDQLRSMSIHQINVLPAEQIQGLMTDVVASKRDHYEFVHRRADGSLRNMDVYSGPIEVGGRTLLYSILHDATDREQAKEANARLLHILESSLNEIYIFSPESLRFEYVNHAARENLGYSHEAMRAMTPIDLKPQFTEGAFRAALAPLLRREQKLVSFETVHRRKDGSLYPVEVHVQLAGPPDQQVFLAVILDITERRAAEDALSTRLNQLEIMHELALLPERHAGKALLREGLERIVRILGSQVGFLHLLLEDQETLELTAWTAETRRHCTASFDTHYPVAMAGIWADAVRLRRPVVHNDYLARPDRKGMPEGHFPLTREIVVPIVEAGQVRMIVGVGNKAADYDEADVNQLEVVAGDLWKGYARQCMEAEIQDLNRTLEHRVEQRTHQLEAANEELEAFAYSVSHDLRAPLRTIAGFSDALSRDADSTLSLEGLGHLRRIQGGATRMAQLIEDLLQLSRIGRDDCTMIPLDLGALAEQVLARLRESEPDRPVRLDVARPIRVTGDPRLLRVLLENLLGNAWKFTAQAPDPRIWVTSRAVSSALVEVTVHDNGAGFPASQVGRLFTPFQRLHKVEEFPGTGIGLAIAKRIVSRHGGSIRAEGTVDHGAAFSFTLPGPTGGVA
jgi:PAS domain S-box-containing protein